MHRLSANQMEDVEAQLRAGNKIAAIKAYMDHVGVGLREAKDAVEDLQRGMLPQGGDETNPLPEGQSMPEDRAAEITESLFAGEKIQAIKVYREAMGGGLKDAKQAVDALESELRRECPEKFQFAAKQGCLGVLLCLCFTGALTAYFVG